MKPLRRDPAKHKRFEALTLYLTPDLYRYAFWCTCDRVLAQDVVRESLRQAWRAFDRLKDERTAKLWLFTIVRRENVRMFERKRPRIMDIGACDQSTATNLSIVGNTEVDAMRSALAQLDVDYREPLVLQVLIGFTINEIADLMGLKRGVVLTRLVRAREKLRAFEETELAGKVELSVPQV